MRQNGHAANITLSANTNTLWAVWILENNYEVYFSRTDSIGSVLGFNKDLYTADYQQSEYPVNILSIVAVWPRPLTATINSIIPSSSFRLPYEIHGMRPSTWNSPRPLP